MFFAGLLQHFAPAIGGNDSFQSGEFFGRLALTGDDFEHLGQRCNQRSALIASIDASLLKALFTAPHDLCTEFDQHDRQFVEKPAASRPNCRK